MADMIDAIRSVRNDYGTTLKEAKDLWDAHGSEEAMRRHLDTNGLKSLRQIEMDKAAQSSKRELFAAMALQGLVCHPSSGSWTPEETAQDAVEYADCLLAALKS